MSDKTTITIDFFSEKKNIALPSSHKELCNIIRKEYKLSQQELNNLQIKYVDSENDMICLDNEEDFRMFIQLVEMKESNTISIDIAQQSKINANKPIEQEKGFFEEFVNFLQKIPGSFFN